jgi:hypothetical protein
MDVDVTGRHGGRTEKLSARAIVGGSALPTGACADRRLSTPQASSCAVVDLRQPLFANSGQTPSHRLA